MLMKGFPKSKGFTQMELLIVIAIIAITATFTVPNIPKWRARARLNGAARELATHFQLAKLEAAKRDRFCAVTFGISIDGTAYDAVVYVDDGAGDEAKKRNLQWDAGEDILRRLSLADSIYQTISLDPSQGGGDGLTIADNAMGQPSIAFNSRGLPIDHTGNIIAAGADSVFIRNDQGGTKTITVSPAGNISITN